MLNLRNNQITIIDDQAFCCLPSLSSLDLSFNPLKRLDADTFGGVRTHLQKLEIANTSLTLLPSFQLAQLKMLNVSSNHLTFVPANTLANLSDVRHLDLSHNELPAPPSAAWHSMHHLRTLNLAGNPISQVMNDSFLGLDKLETLDITDIKANLYQVHYSYCAWLTSINTKTIQKVSSAQQTENKLIKNYFMLTTTSSSV